jgi:hypothetical protein
MKHTDNRPPAGIQIRRRSVNFGGTGMSGRSTCATRDIPSQRTRVSVSHSRSRSSSDRLAPSAYLLDGDRPARHQPHCFRCDAWTRRDLDVACDHHPGLHDGGPEAPRVSNLAPGAPSHTRGHVASRPPVRVNADTGPATLCDTHDCDTRRFVRRRPAHAFREPPWGLAA